MVTIYIYLLIKLVADVLDKINDVLDSFADDLNNIAEGVGNKIHWRLSKKTSCLVGTYPGVVINIKHIT